MFTRRRFLTRGLVAGTAGGLGVGTAGAAAIDTLGDARVTRYDIRPRAWRSSLSLNVAAIADVHACEPWMTVERIEDLVTATNALKPDLIVLLGDYVVGHRKITGKVAHADWARALGRLSAPCGVYAILGNHDWWDDPTTQVLGGPLPVSARALEAEGIRVLHNEVVQLAHQGQTFNVAGLGDQQAFHPRNHHKVRRRGLDDLKATLAAARGGGPIMLLAHEPDIFPRVPDDVAVTFSGHTHGGQVRIGPWIPVVPSRYGTRYAYGHIVEDGRHLVVSAGLGCSWFPVRFGVPSEIVLTRIASGAAVA